MNKSRRAWIRMRINRFIFSIFLIVTCCQCSTINHESEQKPVPQTAITDTIATASKLIKVELLYRFENDDFAEEMQSLFSEYFSLLVNRKSPYSLFATESQNFMPYPWVSQNLYLFYDQRFFNTHKPMIIAIYTQNSDTLVKLNYTRIDSTGIATSLATNNFGVTRSGGRYLLQNMVYLNTRNLEVRQVGNITYFFDASHDFSLEAAREMQAFNLKAAQLFQTESLYFRYFVCKSNIELMQLRGFDYTYDMFNMDNSSGLCDPANYLIYAGNSSEYYPHEVVHLYTKSWEGAKDHHEWFDEGLATYLGGSRNRPLEWHLEGLAKYLRENNYPDISDPFGLPHQINNTTGTIYVIGGLICKLAFEKGGMDAVKELFMAGKEKEGFYKGIENALGIKKDGLNDFLYAGLNDFIENQ